jgi:glucose-1-phosphate adenylyltransferase
MGPERIQARRSMHDVIGVILGGGRGSRLFPLTLNRSKPAVPIGGNYRIIDVPVSNCLHSDIRRIYVLTQYQSESLNKHISNTYKFDIFSSGFVTVVAAEQTEERSDWFQGTADAVRRSMRHVGNEQWDDVLILSGDQLYRMDFREMLHTHRESHADATVAVKEVPPEQSAGLGIMRVDKTGRIVHFEEKPTAERLGFLESWLPDRKGPAYLASMGIYIFRRPALKEALSRSTHDDFGRHVIPAAVTRLRVQAHVHHGYWEDVGTIGSYFEANMALTSSRPPFSFWDARKPIYTHPRFLPATKIHSCDIRESLISEGSFIGRAHIERSVIGIRSRIADGASIRNSLILGADVYESAQDIERSLLEGTPPIGIGAESVIENAIVDKNARVGRGVHILNEKKERECDATSYHIRDGIVVVPKDAVIPDGSVI